MSLIIFNLKLTYSLEKTSTAPDEYSASYIKGYVHLLF